MASMEKALGLQHKISAHIWTGKRLTISEWAHIKTLPKELKFKRGDEMGDKVFFGYNRTSFNGSRFTTKEFLDLHKARVKKHTIDNKPLYRGYANKWREKNPEKTKASCQKYATQNKIRIAAYKVEYYQSHKVESHAAARAWTKNNPEKSRILNSRKYEKLKKNPNTITALKLRNRLRGMVPPINGNKLRYSRGIDVVSAEFLMWLAAYQNLDLINGNYHIDHIIPISKWDLSTEENQRTCNAPTNIRWLYGPENISKNDSLPAEADIESHLVLVNLWRTSLQLEIVA